MGEKSELYRLYARIPENQGEYLIEKKWKTGQSISTIIAELIEEDMKKHPEIIEDIDELNQ